MSTRKADEGLTPTRPAPPPADTDDETPPKGLYQGDSSTDRATGRAPAPDDRPPNRHLEEPAPDTETRELLTGKAPPPTRQAP